MTTLNDIIFGDLSSFERRGEVFVYGIRERMKASLTYIEKKYKNKDKLKLADDFVSYLLVEAVRADFQQLESVGYYPATEAEMELDHAIKHALIGSYKAAFADLRRALELVLVFAYLTGEKYDKEKARDWILSKSKTPFFSESIKQLIKTKRYKELNDKLNWGENLKKLYHQLSGFNHNKGKLKGYRDLNKTRSFINNTSNPSINFTTLDKFCDFYIRTVEEIVVILSLYNPMILVGAPIEEKFGFDGPASGFFYTSQTEIVHKLIPEKYKDYFKVLSETDDEVVGVIESLDSLPDITEEEYSEQIKKFRSFLDEMKEKNRDSET